VDVGLGVSVGEEVEVDMVGEVRRGVSDGFGGSVAGAPWVAGDGPQADSIRTAHPVNKTSL